MADTDRQAILTLLRAQDEAHARADAAAAVATLAETMVSYDLPPPLEDRSSPPERRGHLETWYATWEGGVTIRLKEPEILLDGDLAVVFGLSHMTGTKKDAGPVDIWNRRTVVLRRGADGWRIVHEHSSYPMLMDGSRKAALELKP